MGGCQSGFSGGGGGGGSVGPGTVNYFAVFTAPTAVGDSLLPAQQGLVSGRAAFGFFTAPAYDVDATRSVAGDLVHHLQNTDTGGTGRAYYTAETVGAGIFAGFRAVAPSADWFHGLNAGFLGDYTFSRGTPATGANIFARFQVADKFIGLGDAGAFIAQSNLHLARSASAATALVEADSNTVADAPAYGGRRSRGVLGTPVKVENSDPIVFFKSEAWCGQWFATGYMQMRVAAATTTNQRPASVLDFYLNTNNAVPVLSATLAGGANGSIYTLANASGINSLIWSAGTTFTIQRDGSSSGYYMYTLNGSENTLHFSQPGFSGLGCFNYSNNAIGFTQLIVGNGIKAYNGATTGQGIESYGVGTANVQNGTFSTSNSEWLELRHTGTVGLISVRASGSATSRDMELQTSAITWMRIKASTGIVQILSGQVNIAWGVLPTPINGTALNISVDTAVSTFSASARFFTYQGAGGGAQGFELGLYAADGTPSSPSNVAVNFQLGSLRSYGYNGGFQPTSAIEFAVSAALGANIPSEINIHTSSAASGKTLAWTIKSNGQLFNRIAANEATGGGTAAFGAANCPAVTATAVYKWLRVTTADGDAGFIPVWK